MHATKPAVEPIGNLVFIKRNRPDATTPGGIALPDYAKESPQSGVVVAVGPGIPRPATDGGEESYYPMQCRVGDKVLLPWQVNVVRLNPADESSELVVCPETSLLAILR